MSTTNQDNDSKKSVLVTGCSSGIGQATAIMLARRGCTVFATVRKDADAERLRKLGLPTLIPLCPVDLTNRDHINHAAAAVAEELRLRGHHNLDALINNAGGGSPAPIELMDLDEFHRELQARVLGSVALVQAVLPLLRQARGRILWIMTPGIIPTPFVTSIHACDFAVNCIVRTLNIELKRWGISSIMICCGGIKTPAGLRTKDDVDALLRRGQSDRIALYEETLRNWSKEMEDFDRKRTEPEKVAEVVYEAITTERPRRRYSVGYMSKAAHFLEILPQSFTDWILGKRF
jgi:NAD(P)-dependent dehydrogenase (short-subunit alcohol dehydrogenase family)